MVDARMPGLPTGYCLAKSGQSEGVAQIARGSRS